MSQPLALAEHVQTADTGGTCPGRWGSQGVSPLQRLTEHAKTLGSIGLTFISGDKTNGAGFRLSAVEAGKWYNELYLSCTYKGGICDVSSAP